MTLYYGLDALLFAASRAVNSNTVSVMARDVYFFLACLHISP